MLEISDKFMLLPGQNSKIIKISSVQLSPTYKALVAGHIAAFGERVQDAVLFPISKTSIFAF